MSDAAYRYELERGPWLNGAGTVLFVMLNPSTADQVEDDPTICRCIRFAQSWGFARLTVGNLYAARATNPRDLFTAHDPVGPGNDLALKRLAHDADEVIVAWGATKHPQPGRAGQVLSALQFFHGAGVSCLGQTSEGHPRHPLYTRADARRLPFQRVARLAA